MKTDKELLQSLYNAYLSVESSGVRFTYDNLIKLKNMGGTEYIPHPKTITNRFGSWENALKQLNIPTNPTGKITYTDENLKDSLHRVYKELKHRGLSLTTETYNKLAQEEEFGDLPSHNTYLVRYGTWKDTLKKVELYDIIKKEEKKELEAKLHIAHAELKKRNKAFNSSTYKQLKKDKAFSHLPVVETYRKKYGSWLNAVKEAGLQS